MSCLRQCECEWRSRLCECEQRFIVLEYVHRHSSRLQGSDRAESSVMAEKRQSVRWRPSKKGAPPQFTAHGGRFLKNFMYLCSPQRGGRGVQRSCPVSCQQQCECEWRSRLCECEQRFIELEYEHRHSSRIKNYLSLDSFIAPMQSATCLPIVHARTLSHGNSTILWKAET